MNRQEFEAKFDEEIKTFSKLSTAAMGVKGGSKEEQEFIAKFIEFRERTFLLCEEFNVDFFEEIDPSCNRLGLPIQEAVPIDEVDFFEEIDPSCDRLGVPIQEAVPIDEEGED